MRAVAALAALLACAGCDRAQKAAPAENSAAEPATGADLVPAPAPLPPSDVPAMSATPAPSLPPPAYEPGSGDGGGPTNSFIVCPGNPRCPKAGESTLPEDVD